MVSPGSSLASQAVEVHGRSASASASGTGTSRASQMLPTTLVARVEQTYTQAAAGVAAGVDAGVAVGVGAGEYEVRGKTCHPVSWYCPIAAQVTPLVQVPLQQPADVFSLVTSV